MKIILTGTKHPEETELEVTLEYVGEEDWTFQIGKMNFTISDLTKVMKFLKGEEK